MQATDDILTSDGTSDYYELGYSIQRQLDLKGFCVLNAALQEQIRKDILAEIDEVRNEGRFYCPHEILHTGLLGENGSKRLARLRHAHEEAQALDALSGRIETIGCALKSNSSEIDDFQIRARTPVFLHESSLDSFSAAPFTETDALEWLDWYTWTRILVIFFLGPSSGTLYLYLNDEDSVRVEMTIKPGTCIILRSDRIKCVFEPTDRSYAAGAWFLEQLPKHSWFRSKVKDQQHGSGGSLECHQDLDEWLTARLKTISEEREKEKRRTPEYRSLLPSHLETAMTALCYNRPKHKQTAVRGSGFEFPHISSGTSWTSMFFSIMSAGTDLATRMQEIRWNHEEYYDPVDPEKVYLRHCCCLDLVTWEMFDNAFFGTSRAESAGLAPYQRKALENSYVAFFQAGWSKKTLQRSLTGVYVGSGLSDEATHSTQMGMGQDNSMFCGRVGFCLNLMGPMMSIDAHGASGLLAAQQAVHSLHVPDPPNTQALAIGAYMMLHPLPWKFLCIMGKATRWGRCMSFDMSADGYGLSEGTGTIYLEVFDDEKHDVQGLLSSQATASDGKKASLVSPPNAASLQLMFQEATYSAGITRFDVDAVELHASGIPMEDAVETAAILKVCNGEGADHVFSIGSGKSAMMYSRENAGMMQLFKVMQSLNFGANVPNLHLRGLSPDIDQLDPESAAFQTELMPMQSGISNVIALSHGWGGSGAVILLSSVPTIQAENRQGKRQEQPSQPPFSFWPGGSRDLENPVKDKRYTIIGSWSSYSKVEHMRWEGGGRCATYGYILTLGENRYEHFQIWLDGDPKKVLHPEVDHAPNESAAFFSSTEADDLEINDFSTYHWQLDGRNGFVQVPSSGDLMEFRIDPRTELPYLKQDEGKPGDKYHIRLHVAGKYHMVDWERIRAKTLSKLDDMVFPSMAKYYISGNWANWNLQDMSPIEDRLGSFHFFFTFEDDGPIDLEFLIVRNQDWNQVFSPSENEGEVFGPSPGYEWTWKISGNIGERFRIHFKRSYINGVDTVQLHWHKVSDRNVTLKKQHFERYSETESV